MGGMVTPADEKTYRLVNKRTGKLASGTSWLLDLAACAVVDGDHSGITSLLPQREAEKLLLYNELKPFKKHNKTKPPEGAQTSHSELRDLARRAYPHIAFFYITQVVGERDPRYVNKKGFRAWIMDSLANPRSDLNKYLAQHLEFSALVGLLRGDDWWRKVQK